MDDERVMGELVDLWRQALNAQVDADTDFFDAGGRSLAAARITHQASAFLGFRVSLRDLFYAPTPRTLAARLLTKEERPTPQESRRSAR